MRCSALLKIASITQRKVNRDHLLFSFVAGEPLAHDQLPSIIPSVHASWALSGFAWTLLRLCAARRRNAATDGCPAIDTRSIMGRYPGENDMTSRPANRTLTLTIAVILFVIACNSSNPLQDLLGEWEALSVTAPSNSSSRPASKPCLLPNNTQTNCKAAPGS
jgi:hypothetical protein